MGEERRDSGRVPLGTQAIVQVQNGRREAVTHQAQILNMSGTGILFESEADLPVGKRLEISILWPAKLDNKCDLKLLVNGRVVRREGNQTAMTVEKKEFRTAGRAFTPPTES